MTVFRLARSSRKRKNAKPFNVHQLTFSDMLDLPDLSKKIIKNRNKDENGATVKWLKIKCLKYEKSKPNCFQYRYDFTTPHINVFTKGRGRQFSMPTEINKAYSTLLPISQAKKNDLERLCTLGIIPIEVQEWYYNLPVSQTARDVAPESGEDDSEDDE